MKSFMNSTIKSIEAKRRFVQWRKKTKLHKSWKIRDALCVMRDCATIAFCFIWKFSFLSFSITPRWRSPISFNVKATSWDIDVTQLANVLLNKFRLKQFHWQVQNGAQIRKKKEKQIYLFNCEIKINLRKRKES